MAQERARPCNRNRPLAPESNLCRTQLTLNSSPGSSATARRQRTRRACMSAPDKVRVSAVLPEIQVQGPFPTIAVTEGSTITFEYGCPQGATLSMQFTDSTISAKYLPASMRKQ